MPAIDRRRLWHEQLALSLCLLAQACILLIRLDLLPVWGDEHFTLQAASRSVGGLLGVIAEEKNNPPLHTLLLHYWLRIPWPTTEAVAARALSVILTLGATVAIYKLWLRRLSPFVRMWFLVLWTTSPCLLLYGRMARSYSLQVLLFAVAAHAAVDLTQEKRRIGSALLLAVAGACLLYAHYLPGLALLASVLLVAGWRSLRQGKAKPLLWAGSSVLLAVALFSPWLPELWVAMGRMAHAAPRLGASNMLATELIRPGYWFFSFSFGESPPLWVWFGAMLVSPAVAYLLWRGLRRHANWEPLIVTVAVIGYLTASRWVSFVFIPARLLFLLPFFLLAVLQGAERSRRAGWVVCGALVLLSVGSMASYFRESGFLNKAYLLPYSEIAHLINENSAGETAIVVADACNLDPGPLEDQVRRNIPVIFVSRESTLASVRRRVSESGAATVWYFRNTHDVSPQGLNSELEAELRKTREVHSHLYIPYSRLDRLFMAFLGWQQRPTHFVQLLEMRRVAGSHP